MKLKSLFENQDLQAFVKYDDEAKHIRGTNVTWLKNIKATKADVKNAMEQARQLDSYKKIQQFDKTGPLAAVRGSFYFAKPGNELKNVGDFYIVYANGQIRGTSYTTPHKLKSPKPQVKSENPVEILVDVYDGAFKQLAGLIIKAHTPNETNGFPTTKEEVIRRLKTFKIQNYTINDDLTVDVSGDVELWFNKLKNIPVRFGKVSGNFLIQGNLFLESLEGSPTYVGGTFNCSRNKLTSLSFGPKQVGGNYFAMHCLLTSLEGMPLEVGGSVALEHNKLPTLKGAPREVGQHFECKFNKLTDLVGAPRVVGGLFSCTNNKITTLKGAPREVGGNFFCFKNELSSIEGISRYIGGDLWIGGNNFKPNDTQDVRSQLEDANVNLIGRIRLEVY